MPQKRLVIIDGFSLLFRAFYGTRYLATTDGRPTNALYGFITMLFHLFESTKPDALVVALDAPGKTFRHADYAEYKGTRRETPQELVVQLESCRDMIRAFNIPVIEAVGYEADDVVGTLSLQAESKGYDTYVVTGDLDSLQLVDPCVHIMTTKKGVTDVVIYDEAAVRERYGFGPEHVTDYKALVGDTSDNIPGVPGIGEKSATLLIQEFGTVEQIIERIAEVPEKFRKKLEGNEDRMRHSKWLATIVRDAPVEFSFEPYRMDLEHVESAKDLLTSLEFRSQVKRLEVVLAPYMSGATGTNPAPVVVTSENLEVDFKAGAVGFDELAKWVGGNRFAVLPAQPVEQASLLDEPSEGLAYVAVGNEVRNAAWEDAVRLFGARPSQAVAYDSKPFYKEANPPSVPPGFDVVLASYVLQSGRSSYDLLDIAQGFLDYAAPKTPEQKAACLLHLWTEMSDRLVKEQQLSVLTEIEMPLVPVLAEMEKAGIALSVPQLEEFSKQLETEVGVVQKRVYELAEQEFNIGSPKQIGEVLFEKMSLPGGKKTKTGWATGVEILGELAEQHEIAAGILQYRELTKLKSTYADSLPKMVKGDGRIHTTFNQTVAATGRLSSTDPNLQNIPVRTELGRQIRKAFVAASGKDLWSFDYSQIELRILAHMCGDENLVNAFQEREDVHTVTASLMFAIGADAVTKEQRRLAKMLNYAVLYGVTGFGLANQLGTGFSVEDAGRLIKQYNERFPKVKAFTVGMVEEARSKGFTVTLRGRRRYFPDIHAGNRLTRAYAERQAMNAPLQGTAADMIKLAMLDVAKLMAGQPSQMLLQVHDELVFEGKGADMAAQCEPIRAAMENALPMNVPVEVDAKHGPNWLEMKEVSRP